MARGRRSRCRILLDAACAGILVLGCGAVEAAKPAEQLADRSEGYQTADEAFIALVLRSGAGAEAFARNREIAIALYRLPDRTWHGTRIREGRILGSAIPYDEVPADAEDIASVHTHGQPRVPGDDLHTWGTDFSGLDRENAIRNFRMSRGRISTHFLLNSRMEPLRLTVRTEFDRDSGSIRILARQAPLALPHVPEAAGFPAALSPPSPTAAWSATARSPDQAVASTPSIAR
jgi:hypothetical protein